MLLEDLKGGIDMKIKMLIFNIVFVIVEIILYSKGLVNLLSMPIVALVVGVLSIGAFIGVNYYLLNDTGSNKALRMERLKTLPDYQEALDNWSGRGNPFHQEIREAQHQLELFQQKETALKTLLGDEAEEGNPFIAVSDDVNSCLLGNMKKIVTRMSISDFSDSSQTPANLNFLKQVIEQNKQILSQYDNLIIEVSQIGTHATPENLENITNALRQLRDNNVNVNLSDF